MSDKGISLTGICYAEMKNCDEGKLTDRLWKVTDPELDGGTNVDDIEFIFMMFVQYAFKFLKVTSVPNPRIKGAHTCTLMRCPASPSTSPLCPKSGAPPHHCTQSIS